MERLTKTAGLYLESEILWSDAFWELTAAEIHILLIFKMKCRYAGQKEAKKMKVPLGTIKNNGTIVFSEIEAIKVGISKATFQRAITHFVELGFIDITREGGLYRLSLYALSERWKLYGTNEFKIQERKKRDCPARGFIKRKKQNPRHQK